MLISVVSLKRGWTTGFSSRQRLLLPQHGTNTGGGLLEQLADKMGAYDERSTIAPPTRPVPIPCGAQKPTLRDEDWQVISRTTASGRTYKVYIHTSNTVLYSRKTALQFQAGAAGSGRSHAPKRKRAPEPAPAVVPPPPAAKPAATACCMGTLGCTRTQPNHRHCWSVTTTRSGCVVQR